MVYYGEILAHLKGWTPLTCVVVFIFSPKISGLLRSLSVGTLICRASLIQHLLITSLFTPFRLKLSEKGQFAFMEAKLGQALVVFQIIELKSEKESEGRSRILDRFTKSYKSRSS